MEDAGRIRRGYFVGGVGATQFALPAALDLLRSLAVTPDEPEVVVLAATDPANPYGTILKWPALAGDGEAGGPRSDAHGRLAGRPRQRRARRLHQSRRASAERLPAGGRAGAIGVGRALAARLAATRPGRTTAALPILIGEINGVPAPEHPLAEFLIDAGFSPSAMGFQMRRHA